MVDASRGAGMVFICNPNNPTSTLHPLSDIEIAVREIKQRSPETAILIDEAYIEYSTAPGGGLRGAAGARSAGRLHHADVLEGARSRRDADGVCPRAAGHRDEDS